MLTLSTLSTPLSGLPILVSGRKTSFFIADTSRHHDGSAWDIFQDRRIFTGNPNFQPPLRVVTFPSLSSCDAALKAAEDLEILPLQA